jgi:hypothetical protein
MTMMWTYSVSRAGWQGWIGNSDIGYTIARRANRRISMLTARDLIATPRKLCNSASNEQQERSSFEEHGSRCDDTLNDL